MTSDRALLYAGIDRLTADGSSTNITDGAYRGVEQVKDEVNPTAVIIFSDGANNETHFTLDQAVNLANSNNTSIYSIGVGSGATVEPLKSLAVRTGGIYTTALEFINWDKSLYGDVLVSSAMREAAHTGKIKTDIPDTEYGYGWFIENKPSKPRKIYHTGDNGGFYTFEGRFPDKDLFYLIFANQPHWDRDKTVESVDEIFRRFGWI